MADETLPRVSRHADALAVGSLVLSVVVLYARCLGHEFVEWDDPLYVSANGWVRSGLSWETLRWAFTNQHAFLWHPLTWVSYLVDARLFGAERAGPFLAGNLLLHAGAASLLYLVLARATGERLASLGAAALFALHPIQVESVAWVSGRKEVLAGALFMATLLAYVGYARRGGAGRYGLVLLLAALCLMAKGSLVTLPLLLLLLDAWPLRRERSPRWLLAEKLPLLVLAAADAGLQLAFQAPSRDLAPPDPALIERVPIAILAITGALRRLVWPTGLSVVHPTAEQMGGETDLVAVVVALALLGALTVAALLAWRRAPWLGVGWLWFGLALAPMSGLAPTGMRVMHDRYAYVPMIGLALAFAFVVEHAPPPWRRAARASFLVVLAAFAGLAWVQVDVWRNSFTLFDHALAVNPRDAVSHFARGTAWARAGNVDAAVRDFESALAVQPDHVDAHASLGYLAMQRGELDQAIAHLRRAALLRPRWPLAHVNLARALEAKGDAASALAAFETAAGLPMQTADAHYWLAVALERRGRVAEARSHYERALALDPDHSWSRDALSRLR